MSINICDLSTEVLLKIFECCNIYDLCRLRQCCKRFNIIICVNRIPLHEYDALVTNQIKISIRKSKQRGSKYDLHKNNKPSKIHERSKIILEPYEKWRISHNWKIGRFKTATFLKQRKNFMPWLFLDDRFLWLSEGKYVKAYSRTKNSLDVKQPHFILNNESNYDIVRFTLKENICISGQRNGNLWLWSLDERRIVLNLPQCHNDDVTCVDLSKNMFVSGSHDKTFKIWPLNHEFEPDVQPRYTVNLQDRIWSIGISPSKNAMAIGSSGFNNIPPFHIYDLERCECIAVRRAFVRGSGILDIAWESDATVLTCGYDTTVRKWDMRTGRCERSWHDPHDSALYCLDTDQLYTILCGTNVYGRVLLFDQRMHHYVQMYYTCTNTNKSSPVYSLSFDGCQLFTALDRCVKCLDFTSYTGKICNYGDMY